MRAGLASVGALLLLSSCTTFFPLPMTAAQLAVYDSGPALVAYLGQPDASPTVCDARAQGPHVNVGDAKLRQALVDGLANGNVPPEPWRRCANAILRSARPVDERAWVDTVGRSYREVMKARGFEKQPALQDRVRAMQKFYIDRHHGLNGNDAVDDPLIADLRRALERHKLGPVATQLGDELIDVVDIEHGIWRGRRVDVASIAALFASKDEKTLQRFANRLPDDALRDDARRRVIRLNIAASPYDEVRAHAAAVEEIVMKDGMNPIDLATHPATSASFDMTKAPIRGVLVRQDVMHQQATLLGYSGDRPGVSVLPEMNLRNLLVVSVTGYVRAVTLCDHKKDLDSSPCVPVAQVRIDNPDAYLDQGGAFHFTEHIAMADAVKLAQQRERFVLPVAIAGKPMAELDWRLYYEKPADVILTGKIDGAAGPNLTVIADHRDPARYLFTIASRETLLAVVEAGDAPSFYIASRGAQGFTGSSGSAGSPGADGGECGDGGPGGDGGHGGDGGPGGPGGDIELDVVCGGAPCTDALALMQRQVVSRGGEGGPGGAGGSGGSGGAGGSGRAPTTHTDSDGNTVVDDPGCSGGSSGSSGSDGENGSDGPPGAPGRVRASVVN